jgi:carboxyl-terminal processing protease
VNKRTKNALLPLVAAIALAFGIFISKYIYSTEGKNYSVDFISSSSTQKIQRILDLVRNHYVDSVDYVNIENQIINTVLSHLDPHSTYLSSHEMMVERDRMEGEFGGIGIKFKIVNDTLFIVKVFENAPGAKAGLLPGDKIISVNNKAFVGQSVTNERIVEELRGEPGSYIKMEILRKQKIVNFNIKRVIIPLKSVEIAEYIAPSVAYVKISRFSKKTYEEFMDATKKWNEKDLQGMIIDLRGNPGGMLDQVTKLCDEFLNEGQLIVYTKDKYERTESIATKDGRFKKVPLAILIDEGSASASEVFSGAMQDNDRAIVLGRRSFGKGLVQRPFELNDGAVLRLTIARYYTPAGRSIQRPYEENKEQYYDKINQRLLTGELFTLDSIVLNDSLKYKTPKGKIVYGGGGILPDIFVPMDSLITDSLLFKIYSQALIERFILDSLPQINKKLSKSINIAYAECTDYNWIEMFKTYLIANGVKLGKKTNPKIWDKLKTDIISEILDKKFGDFGAKYPTLHSERIILQAIKHLNVKSK